MTKLVHERPDIISGRVRLESINVTYRDDLLHVNVDGFLPKDLSPGKSVEADVQERLDLFQDYLSADIGEPVVVEFDLILADMLHVSGKRPESPTSEPPTEESDK